MIKRELVIFLVVGTLTVFVDFATYSSLTQIKVMEVNIAKAIGFSAGALFAYFANRCWTFGHQLHAEGNAWRFSALYVSTLGANVFINSLALRLFVDITSAIQVAFLLATVVSACLNFIGMKFFVFKSIQASVIR